MQYKHKKVNMVAPPGPIIVCTKAQSKHGELGSQKPAGFILWVPRMSVACIPRNSPIWAKAVDRPPEMQHCRPAN